MTKKTLTAVLLSSVLLSSVCAVPFAGAAEQNNTDANEEQNSGISTENGEENNYYTATPADEVTDTECCCTDCTDYRTENIRLLQI